MISEAPKKVFKSKKVIVHVSENRLYARARTAYLLTVLLSTPQLKVWALYHTTWTQGEGVRITLYLAS